MAVLIRFDLDPSGSVLFEAADDEPGIDRASRVGDLVESSSTSLAAALGEIRHAASVALRQFQTMAEQPDEVQIEFGVKLTAQAGAVIAKTGLEGHLKVQLTWRNEAAADAKDERTVRTETAAR